MCIHKTRKGYFNMRKTTDINGLRSVAKMMLHLPMTETELYEEVYEAKQRISQKLHKAGEEDADVELIINHMFDICRIVSTKMFEYGATTA